MIFEKYIPDPNLTNLSQSEYIPTLHILLFYECHCHCIHVVPLISPQRQLSITRVLEDGIELNWLPPTEPNGEVHYVIYYTPEDGTEQTIDTGSNLTHYNLTGLERNRVYTNIAVQAVNSAGRSDRSAVIAQYSHTPPSEFCDNCIIINSKGTYVNAT